LKSGGLYFRLHELQFHTDEIPEETMPVK